MDEQNQQNVYGPQEEKGNVVYLIIGLLFPFIGFILYLILAKTNRNNAKFAGIGAIIGFVIDIVIPLVFFAGLVFSYNFVENNGIEEKIKSVETQQYIRKSDFNSRKTLNFKETLKSEEITILNTNYQETDDQITIYLFRGDGCHYCKDFLNFLNDNSKEYGKYFKLESLEVWNDSFNNDLMIVTSEFLNEPAKGVPYIIIGKKVFTGYANSYNEDILTTIKDEYDNKNYRYDVFEEMREQKIIK